MDLFTELLSKRVSVAPWWSRWWWVLLAALFGIAFAVATFVTRRDSQEKTKTLVDDAILVTETVHDNQKAVELGKAVLKDAAETRKKMDELDVQIDDVDARYEDMISRVDAAETLDDLRALRDEIEIKGL